LACGTAAQHEGDEARKKKKIKEDDMQGPQITIANGVKLASIPSLESS
jgi:hypothetical protein